LRTALLPIEGHWVVLDAATDLVIAGIQLDQTKIIDSRVKTPHSESIEHHILDPQTV